MRRVPILPTLFVALAALTMVALGVWQLGRADEKRAMIALMQRNAAQPAEVPFPRDAATAAPLLFRAATRDCAGPIRWDTLAGRTAQGAAAWRYLGTCASGVVIDAGVMPVQTAQLDRAPTWSGGRVTGRIVPHPRQPGVFARLLGEPSPPPVLWANPPVPGLNPSAAPDPSATPNNHLAYAGQWFLFALAAVVIYALALRLRIRPSA